MNYWQQRTADNLTQSEQQGVVAIARALTIYQEAERNIQTEVDAIYRNYSKNGILDVQELQKVLTDADRQVFLSKVGDQIRKLGLNPNVVYDDRYLYRLTRLQALIQQMKWEIANIAPQEVASETHTYANIITQTYSTIQQQFQEMGGDPAFATLDKSLVNSILQSRWQGGNYSSRIWSNTDLLANDIESHLAPALVSGSPLYKVINQLDERFNVGKYNATRLVRTEANYMHNQSIAQSYTDNGVEQYIFEAILDERTSDICRETDGQIFNVSDMEVGINYPPMLPNCRSSTSIIIPENPQSTPQDRTSRLDIGPSNGEIQNDFVEHFAKTFPKK